jgi:RNA polymerase sigma factor (sigma-70 family)
MDDWQLLQNYVERESETAFGTLVNRYVNLVYSVALRYVRDAQLAEEVAQAVFILLARKARGFRQGVVISGWLFRTTRFVASRAVRSEQRRQRREQEALSMQQLTATDDAWKRISPAIDEALESLGDADRNALLLRFYNEKSHRETAIALGVSEDAAKKRVTRALEKLRSFFAGRGITLSVGLLASAVAANAVKPVTPEVAASIGAKAFVHASIAAGALPPLVVQTLNTWRWMKVKLAGACVILGTAAIVLVTSALSKGPAQSAGPATALGAASPGPMNQGAGQLQKPARSWNSNRARTMRFHVVARDNGDAVPFARLAVGTVVDRDWAERFDLMTDETGLCELPLPAGLVRLDAGVMASGWEARFATWRLDTGNEFPSEYTLRVQRVTNFVGGWLRDEAGQPVAEAEIRMQFGRSGDSSSRETPRERMGLFSDAAVAKTDRTGRWTCALIPFDNQQYYSFEARHPNFAPTRIESGSPDSGDEDVKRESFRQLWARTLVTSMNRGLALVGHVTDEADQPIPQTLVHHQPLAAGAKPFTADAEGKFTVPNLATGSFSITVTAPGFAPEHRDVVVIPDMAPVDFRLKPGALLRLQIVDEQGVEIPDARVVLEQWGEHRHVLNWNASSGPDGRIEWNSAPTDRLQLCALKDGWCFTRDVWVKPNGEEHRITMQRALNLVGRVTDAETGLPIPEFKAFPGYGDGPSEQVWERLDTRRGENGDFKVSLVETRQPWRVRVEAEGYLPEISEPLSLDFSGTLELRLKRLKEVNGIKGVVRLPDGQPAVGAEVALCSFEHWIAVQLSDTHFVRPFAAPAVRTDDEGGYSFEQNQEAHTLIATHAAGFARVRLRQGNIEIVLQPWGRIEGAVLADVAAIGELKAVLTDWASAQYRGGLELDKKFFNAPLDASGRFVLPKVPPGNFYVCLEHGLNARQILHTPASVPPGGTAQVQVGGLGRLVVGRFDAGEVHGVTNWEQQVLAAVLFPAVRTPRPRPTGLSGEGAKNWEVDFWQSEAGHNGLFTDRSFTLDVAPEGTFTAYDVPPGSYNLHLQIGRSPSGISGTIGDLSEKIVVPEASGVDRQTVDLGTLVLRKSKE